MRDNKVFCKLCLVSPELEKQKNTSGVPPCTEIMFSLKRKYAFRVKLLYCPLLRACSCKNTKILLRNCFIPITLGLLFSVTVYKSNLSNSVVYIAQIFFYVYLGLLEEFMYYTQYFNTFLFELNYFGNHGPFISIDAKNSLLL